MNRNELLAKMQNIAGTGKSQLHMRSEAIQNRQTVKRLPMLKKGLKKKSKLLIIADLAIPFNPETGTEDEQFNADTKWRPPYSATTVALMLKTMANDNEALKKTFMRRAGLEDWDTSDVENLNDVDKSIFIKYRVPRIFTVPVVSVNIPAMTKNDFGREYSIDVEIDPMTGEVVGKVPGVLKVNKLFRDKIYLEVQEFQNKVDSGETKLTEKQVKEQKSDIYKKNPVSDVHPSNWVTIIELPLNAKYELSADVDYAAMTGDSVSKRVVLTRLSKGIKDAMASYTDGSWQKFDKSLDYFEVDMNCPTEGDENSQQGKMLIGKDTKFEKPTNGIDECLSTEELATVTNAVRDYLDSCEGIEEEVRRSMFISPYTEDVEDQIYRSLETVLDIENDKFLTQDVILANSEVISIAFGGKGDELLDAIDAGVSDAPEGALDEEASKESAKQYSVAELESEDSFDVSLDEVVID